MKNDGAAIKWRAEHEGSSIFSLVLGIIVTSHFLYYSRKLAQECGYEETIALSYTYRWREISGENEEKMQQAFESFMNRQRKVFLPLTLTNMMKYYLSQKRRHDHSIRICRETQHQMSADTIHTIEIHI